jgi:hypothetical protein
MQFFGRGLGKNLIFENYFNPIKLEIGYFICGK